MKQTKKQAKALAKKFVESRATLVERKATEKNRGKVQAIDFGRGNSKNPEGRQQWTFGDMKTWNGTMTCGR